MSLSYEEQEQLEELLSKKFESFILSKLDEIVAKYAPVLAEKLEARLTGTFTPEVNILFAKKLKETVEQTVDAYLRLFGGPSELGKLVHESLGKHLDSTIEFRVKSLLEQRTEAALKALQGKI